MNSARREPKGRRSYLKKMERSDSILRNSLFDILRFCGSLFNFLKFHTSLQMIEDKQQRSDVRLIVQNPLLCTLSFLFSLQSSIICITSETVMPWIPIPFRASFTSSSLKGLMIASTFCIRHLSEIEQRLRGAPAGPPSGGAALAGVSSKAYTRLQRPLRTGEPARRLPVPPRA